MEGKSSRYLKEFLEIPRSSFHDHKTSIFSNLNGPVTVSIFIHGCKMVSLLILKPPI
jgi:hypothetical protein